MKVIGLNGKVYTLQFNTSRQNASDLHLKARQLLHDLFKPMRIIEELFIPGAARKLYLDFFIPLKKLAIEVQGSQHYQPSWFHRSQLDYIAGLFRDDLKIQFCQLNHWDLVHLPYNKIETWKDLILCR